MNVGIVRRVIGPVVDVQFPGGHLPEIYNAIDVLLEDRKIVLEAVQHLDHDSVRCISLFSTDSISRGCKAIDTGVSPSKGKRPVIISYITTPREYRSVRLST